MLRKMILRRLTTLFLALGLVVLCTDYGRADVENEGD